MIGCLFSSLHFFLPLYYLLTCNLVLMTSSLKGQQKESAFWSDGLGIVEVGVNKCPFRFFFLFLLSFSALLSSLLRRLPNTHTYTHTHTHTPTHTRVLLSTRHCFPYSTRPPRYGLLFLVRVLFLYGQYECRVLFLTQCITIRYASTGFAFFAARCQT